MPEAIKAEVTIGTPILPPTSAVWSLVHGDDGKPTGSTATLMGGVAVISRREDGNFHGRFEIMNPPGEPGEDGVVPDATIRYHMSINLVDSANLTIAQKRCELRIREHLSKSHPELHAEITANEAAEALNQVEDDPF